ncbi:MAG: sulfatase-like hydrolase/transferase [Kiritimatiellae bacterium]|nr:sulfatase-like hydrolase/transferase [Kiritimatiellia bacterium]
MPGKPNILFVTADHLRYDTLGCNGDPVIQTPAIDRLAAEGVCFDNGFVQNPVCQPSRATLMTGRYPRHHGVRWNGNRLDENEMTLPEFLRNAGYATACVGKHHIGQKRFLDAFDHMAAGNCRRNWAERADGDYTVDRPNPFEQYVRERGHEYKTGYALPGFRANLGAVPSDLPDDCHIDAYVGMKAREYLENLSTDKPFFLWLGFYGPHHPYVPSGRFARMYEPDSVPSFRRAEGDIGKKPPEYGSYFHARDHKFRGFDRASEATFRRMKAAYYGMVSQLDWQLGLTLDLLHRKGLAPNTIVVLTSDHGDFLGDHGIAAKGPFLLDCMLHVPLIVRAPGCAPGTRSDALVESVDVFPTLAALAGEEPPEWVQGRRLCGPPAAQARDNQPARDAVYAEAVDKKCIRTRDWKYIHYPAKPYGELYDLREDPYELNNLHAERPDKAAEMRAAFYALLDATEDFRHPSYKRFSGTDPASGRPLTHYHTW